MSNFSFGSDPEFFLMLDNKTYSAIDIIKADKDNRIHSDGNAFYYDNILAECSVDPTNDKESAITTLRKCLRDYAKVVAPYKLTPKASCDLDWDQLANPKALEIGCSPETCAYTKLNIVPDQEAFKVNNLRTAGGHIHIGSEIFTPNNKFAAIRTFDLFLGVMSTYVDHDPTSPRRKQLYGKAGRYRAPSYGIEYRSLGNFWLVSPIYVDFIYDVSDFIVDLFESGKINDIWKISVDEAALESETAFSQFKGTWGEFVVSCYNCESPLFNQNDLRSAIDNFDKEAAKPFLEIVKKFLPANIFTKFVKLSEPKFYNMYREWVIKV